MSPLRLLAALPALLFASALLAAPQEQKPQKPAQLDPAASCTTKCHEPIAKGEFVHKPIAEGKCTACHKQEKATAHEFAPIDDVGETCRTCHKIQNAKNVHAPIESVDCTACHDAHHGAMKSLLRAPDEPTLCYTCHDPVKQAIAKKFPHGPAAEGFCTGCHKGHSSDQPKLLTFEPVELCTKCHTDINEAVGNAESVHAPVSIDCMPCHNPHGSDQEHLVKDPQPGLCFTCHKPMAEAVAGSKNPHGAMTTGKQCMSCHRPHESKQKTLLRGTSQEVCATCHSKELPRKGGGRPLAAVSAEAAAAKVPHKPVKDGDCTACHKPHVAPFSSLLGKAYPARFYEPYKADSYELCFGCHDKKRFEAPKGKEQTGFRDGERNLHLVHVGDKDKGRTCRACHEVHGGDAPKLLAAAVPFGTWALPIRWQETPTGGRCAPGCHKPFEYSREPGGVKAPKPAPKPPADAKADEKPAGKAAETPAPAPAGKETAPAKK